MRHLSIAVFVLSLSAVTSIGDLGFAAEGGETHAGGRTLGGDGEKQNGTEDAGGTPGAEECSAQRDLRD